MQTARIYLDQSMFSIIFFFCTLQICAPSFADAVVIDSAGRSVAPLLAPMQERKTIRVDFHKADIHAVMRFFARVGDTNILLDDAVQGTVTMRLEDVSWEEAFRAVLWSQGLVAVTTESMVVISAP